MTNRELAERLGTSKRQVSKTMNLKGSQPILVRKFILSLKPLGPRNPDWIQVPENIQDIVVDTRK